MNIAERLVDIARKYPDNIAVAEPRRTRAAFGKPTTTYKTITFAQLNEDTDRIAEGLKRFGVQRGMRLALFVRYGIDFISLVFAICKTEAALVLIDPGMGIRKMFQCLEEVEPDGFIGIPTVQLARVLMRKRFPKAKYNVTVGRRWGWSGTTLKKLRETNITTNAKNINASSQPLPAHDFQSCDSHAEPLAAIIFTSGSTGPAKGVAFSHSIFDTQVSEIQKRLGIQPGEIDLACFPFFGLFDAAMGVTAVLPNIDTSKPASADPAKIVEAANAWKITQSFASPAIWNNVADYCRKTGKKLETLKRAVSAGAPVSDKILEKLKPCIHPDGDIYTPYGATESLPVAVISATERLGECLKEDAETFSQPLSPQPFLRRGVCVGKRFETIDWKVIAITDTPIARLENAVELPVGAIGELAVAGPQVTKEYVNRPRANALSKMLDSEGRTWHRIGDVGYFDERDRFWFCGRKAHRVETANKTYFSIPCEAVFNQHPKVYRSALASCPKTGMPRMFVEPLPEHYPKNKTEEQTLLAELRQLGMNNPLTQEITVIRLLKHFPVDVRHNIKINREQLTQIE